MKVANIFFFFHISGKKKKKERNPILEMLQRQLFLFFFPFLIYWYISTLHGITETTLVQKSIKTLL